MSWIKAALSFINSTQGDFQSLLNGDVEAWVTISGGYLSVAAFKSNVCVCGGGGIKYLFLFHFGLAH